MKLTIFNGSPRGKNSNSGIIADWLLEGAGDRPDINAEVVVLNRIEEQEHNAVIFSESDISLVVFPLYTDCMPGIVASFFEKLQPYTGKLAGRKIGFVVHSGFPELHHSRYVEQYLIRLAKILDITYMGTVIIGNSESIRHVPESTNSDKRALFNKLGRELASKGMFDWSVIRQFGDMEKLTGFTLLVFKIITRTGIMNSHWKNDLKRNNAYKNSFARPYA